jgi:hypothetical protein
MLDKEPFKDNCQCKDFFVFDNFKYLDHSNARDQSDDLDIHRKMMNNFVRTIFFYGNFTRVQLKSDACYSNLTASVCLEYSFIKHPCDKTQGQNAKESINVYISTRLINLRLIS